MPEGVPGPDEIPLHTHHKKFSKKRSTVVLRTVADELKNEKQIRVLEDRSIRKTNAGRDQSITEWLK